MAIRLGEHDLSTVEDFRKNSRSFVTVQDIDIHSFVAYQQHDEARKINDIGLIRLKSPANLEKPNINTICLPVEKDLQFENLDEVDEDIKQHLIIAGFNLKGTLTNCNTRLHFQDWERDENNSTLENVLIKGAVSHIGMEDCETKLAPIPVFDTWIYAGSISSAKMPKICLMGGNHF